MGLLPDWMVERDVKIESFSPQQHRPGVISYGLTSYGYDVRAGYKWKVFDAIAGGVVDPKNFNPKLLREFDLSPFHVWNRIEDGRAWCHDCNKERDGKDDEEVCPRTQRPNFITIPPNSYTLGESMETFTIPRDVGVICVGKSTYARCGIIVNVTPGEPEWAGKWTIEISNSSPLPAVVYCGEGIMQCMFIRSDGYRARLWSLVEGLFETLGFGHVWKPTKDNPNEMTCRVSYKDKKGIYQGQTGLTSPRVVREDK